MLVLLSVLYSSGYFHTKSRNTNLFLLYTESHFDSSGFREFLRCLWSLFQRKLYTQAAEKVFRFRFHRAVLQNKQGDADPALFPGALQLGQGIPKL